MDVPLCEGCHPLRTLTEWMCDECRNHVLYGEPQRIGEPLREEND